jgi:hypothetical protein
MRALEESPFSPLYGLRGSNLPFWIVLIMLMRPSSAWSGLAMLVILLVLLWFNLRHSFGYGPLAKLMRVRHELPWFFPDCTVRHSLDGVPDLRTTLERHGIGVVELDGGGIANWTDLARDLQEAYGKRTFPADPQAKCIAILQAALGTNPRPKALLWRDANQTLRANPALLLDVMARFRALPHSHWSPFVLFVDLPDQPEPPAGERPLRAVGVESIPIDEIDRKVLAAAPEGAWWQPKPGELAP